LVVHRDRSVGESIEAASKLDKLAPRQRFRAAESYSLLAKELATVIGAWKILACEKGYDCGPDSDYMHTVCDWDAQCADGKTYTDYFKRQLGTGYDEAVGMAKAIEQLIAAKDLQGIKSYL
jgi:hypothetical protein